MTARPTKVKDGSSGEIATDEIYRRFKWSGMEDLPW